MRRRRENESGFTLIELLLALVLLAFGVLALAATNALVVRDVGGAATRGVAAIAARNRVEWLASTPCALLTGGAAQHTHGVREAWTIERRDNQARLRDSVIAALPTVSWSIVVASSRAC
jgi:general secretion pathway protein I